MTTETPSPAHLWKGMSEDQRLRAAEAFWREADSGDQQIEAMVLLAQRLKARPKFIATLPVDKKASTWPTTWACPIPWRRDSW